MAAYMYNVYVGSETGLFKGINTVKGTWTNINTIKTPDKSKEICSLCWTDETETEVCVGTKGKGVALYDVKSQSLGDFRQLDGGKGNLRNAFKVNESFLTAVDTGLVNIWKDGESVSDIQTGSHLHCAAINPHDRNTLGTGGKEADLKIWDIEDTAAPTFSAKNVKHDWLNLRVPVWITGIGFMDAGKIVTCTGHHQVRVYDPNCQRRPVLEMTFDEFPLTAMSLYRDHQVVVGNTQGKLALLDVRTGKLVHTFKGFSGSIRSVACHPNKPVVASCGLDRFLRLHDINTKKLLVKTYLKSRLNSLVLSRHWSAPGEEEEDKEAVSEDVEDEGYSEEEDDDAIWDNMEVVQTRSVKRSDKTKEASLESVITLKRKGKRTDKMVKKKKK